MTPMEADLEAWLAMHERTSTTAALLEALEAMIERIEEEVAEDDPDVDKEAADAVRVA